MRHNPYSSAGAAYKQNNVQSMSPAEQIARLLETAAKHIRRAWQHAEADEFELRFKATEDAQKIITGLSSCLNQDPAAAAMTEILSNYYMGLTLLVTRINVKNCTKSCDDAIKSLTEMAGTWRQIETENSAEAFQNAAQGIGQQSPASISQHA